MDVELHDASDSFGRGETYRVLVRNPEEKRKLESSSERRDQQ
jgi:hypothetical protein